MVHLNISPYTKCSKLFALDVQTACFEVLHDILANAEDIFTLCSSCNCCCSTQIVAFMVVALILYYEEGTEM